MSREIEIRYYNRAGEVVRPHARDALYVIRIVWRHKLIDGVIYRRSEKSAWLKSNPAKKTKLATWKALWAYKASLAKSVRART